MGYEWDPDKAQASLDKHRIDFADAVGVFEDDWALTIKETLVNGEQRMATLGMDFLGRVLVVVYTFRSDDIRLISARPATRGEREPMSEREYSFEQAEQGAVVQPLPGKTRITIRIDTDILDWFRRRVHESGGGNYQTLINGALREYTRSQDGMLEDTLRKVIREELQTIAR